MKDHQIKEMAESIQRLRQCAEELRGKAGGIEAVERNLERIFACIRMLELDVSDVEELI